ncbi:O-acetylhomoserine/O-acetylserine sulfhydrylase [Beijerinckiaceae bacterium RH AL1]|nr:O-acetylhomoserine aminocarboxypropyltransferase/cysteine synthase [Beijerinckiaceae bacterium]VVB48023.1 O-acetylhomoserine/O-acetylserine sulfhydrylase [Beijerinckiaceae bacterium RH CH11]VVB48100.1 O-acetylhomoserine/O-acetylserine sulfhydrylase [Beijerinckiaceae bacterium RH AL8]VVC56183.1 O-acetylhomoserine/O-acetylserine sulfhydrylase [Beijerinckiaceae bacterium RH AL1]
MRNETLAVHGGYEGDPTTHACAVPIYQTVAYEFDSADHGAALFNLEVPGYRYSRIANPTVEVLERRVAAMHGGIAALATSTGQAALTYAISTLADHGGNIVSVPQLYGTTHTLLAHILPRQGITTRFAAGDDVAAIEPLIDGDTKAIYCESIGNPAGNITDIAALADCAHRHGVPLVVDNTVATPVLLRPIEHGADIVVESLTKFMGGHGTTLAGVLVDSGRFRWRDQAAKYPMFCEPDASYHGMVYDERYGAAAYMARARSVYQRATGAVLSPFNAFLILQGIETVALRMERHVANARAVAEFLRADPRVAWVNYAGFEDSPYYGLARRYLGGNASSLFTFGIVGGLEGGKAFYDALRLVKRLVNIGDTKTLACHPASTTHRQMTTEEQAHAGVTPDLIRVSIGIEHVDDIIADFDQALAVAAAASRALAVA